MTVTATQSVHTHPGMLLRVKVLTGIAASPIGATGSVKTTGAPQLAITTTVTGSQVYASLAAYNTATALSANSSTTLFDSVIDSTNSTQYGTGRTTSATGTPGSVTVGSTLPTAGSHQIALLEILASGTITEDSSAPAVVDGEAVTLTTASFTPPAGSLVAAIVTTAEAAGGVQTMTVGDTGGGLTWTQQVSSAFTALGYVGIWTAPVPGGAVAAPASLISYQQAVMTAATW